ncbi:MAG: hypothetical protein GY816_00325 [Cytophagales bacterium]|nr:hypothetical protein [Cytophagales bacterium]
MRQQHSKKWILLEQRIAALESLMDAKIEGSPATGAANEKADQLLAGFITLDESLGNSFTKQNVSTAYWESKGAKPKNRGKVVTSTPLRSAAVKPTLSGHEQARIQQPIKLQNRFECLANLEPAAPRIKTERGLHWNNINKARRQLPVSPTTLVVGDFTVRNVRSGSITVSCLPHASVRETKDSIPQLVSDHKCIDRIIVHCGGNDLFREQLTVRHDFEDLFSTLKELEIPSFISGPIPAPCYRNYAFSRLLSLNNWLAKSCKAAGMNFVDNFNLFWKRRVLFTPNSAELSWTGAKALADQYLHSLGALADERGVSVSTQTNGHINKPSETVPDTVSAGVQTDPLISKSTHTDDAAESPSAHVNSADMEINGMTDSSEHTPRQRLIQLSEKLGELSQKLSGKHSPEDKCSPPLGTGNIPLATPTPPPRSAKKRLSTQRTGNMVSSKPKPPPRPPTPSPGKAPLTPSLPPESAPMPSPPLRNNETQSSTSPSPRLRFPEAMAKLLPFARSSFSTPRHSNHASYTNISQGQPLSTPKSETVLPPTIAPKKGRAPPTPPACALEYNSTNSDDFVECTV